MEKQEKVGYVTYGSWEYQFLFCCLQLSYDPVSVTEDSLLQQGGWKCEKQQ